MRETTPKEIIKAVPAQPQRWWVDYLHAVQSGMLVETMTGKAVLRNSAGYHIIENDQLKGSYIEACVEAVERLSKAQVEINSRLANLMVEMAKQTKGKAS